MSATAKSEISIALDYATPFTDCAGWSLVVAELLSGVAFAGLSLLSAWCAAERGATVTGFSLGVGAILVVHGAMIVLAARRHPAPPRASTCILGDDSHSLAVRGGIQLCGARINLTW